MDFKCVYCQCLITNIRIKCSVCDDYELCLECFASGAESGQHKADHDYQPLNDGFQPLFITPDSKDWRASEELALIEGIEHYGLGNWEAVSCRVQHKSALEVKKHFERHYISGSIGCITKVKTRKYKVTDHTGPVEGPLSPTLTAPLPPLNLSVPEARELGFLPLRDDFEREWDNDAESILSGAIIHHTDEDVDMAYKLSLVSMYRLRLKERRLRKRVARDYSLVNVYTSSFRKGQPGAKKKAVRDYKEFQEKMKKFAQFMTMQEQDRFFNSLQKEKQLKSRIKELIKYRRNGIISLEDAEHFEQEFAKREKTKDLAKKDKRLSAALQATAAAAAAAASEEEEEMDTLETTPTSKRSQHTVTSNNGSDTNDDSVHEPVDTKPIPATVTTPEKKRRNHALPKLEPLFKDILTEKPHNLRSPTNGCHQREQLSETEKRLCRRIGMKTASYTTIKTCILKDYVTRQHGTPVKLRFPAGFDKTHRRTILNFLEQSGWIQMEN